MQKCVLHAGMPKTGTTSIQNFLRVSLNDPRFSYLAVGDGFTCNHVVGAFAGNPRRFNRNQVLQPSREEIAARTARIRQRFSARMAQAEGKVGVFSAEVLPWLGMAELEDFLEAVYRYTSDIRVVVYVRPPGGFMQSALQERIKSGVGKIDPATLFPSYRERFERFEKLLGRDQVSYWLFDPASFIGGCVVRNFCYRLGIRIDADFVSSTNIGLSAGAVGLLYAYNTFGPGIGAGAHALGLHRLLVRRLATLAGPKLRLSGELVRSIVAANAEDCAWISERLPRACEESLGDSSIAISDMDQLLRFTPAAIDWLARQVGREVPGGDAPQPYHVVPAMLELVDKLGRRARKKSIAGARGLA